jgi:arginyl-tRNA--protein-N-Asp/Glu arginylyltransferase
VACKAFMSPSRYAHLSLGKYSVLREVDFVRRASCQQPELQYLYLGYYIPNNEKMMYKVLAASLPAVC